MLVVTVVLLETLVSLPADPEEDAAEEGLWVVVNVLPAEFVVVTTWPAAVVVSVKVVFCIVVLPFESVVV